MAYSNVTFLKFGGKVYFSKIIDLIHSIFRQNFSDDIVSMHAAMHPDLVPFTLTIESSPSRISESSAPSLFLGLLSLNLNVWIKVVKKEEKKERNILVNKDCNLMCTTIGLERSLRMKRIYKLSLS